MKLRMKILTTTVIPAAIALGIAGVATIVIKPVGAARANPCAAKNPCAARKAGNPCAAKSPCNPCAAKSGNPCAARNPSNPCAGASSAGSTNCVVPRLQAAAANPCAAKNPCGAKNPCNPCAPKNPCNPCAAAAEVELSEAEAKAAYDCIIGAMKAAYAKSGLAVAKNYAGWKNYSRVAYSSATHGSRFVNNYADPLGRNYGKYEKSGPMPAGAYLVKDSFTVSHDGKVAVGPLFIMRKMESGRHAASGDWKYAMVMPDGAFFGETNGRNAANMTFCHECHMSVVEEQDSMFFLPEEFRVK